MSTGMSSHHNEKKVPNSQVGQVWLQEAIVYIYALRTNRCVAADLPGFSRSVYAEDHALLTPESRVWAPNTYGWCVGTYIALFWKC